MTTTAILRSHMRARFGTKSDCADSGKSKMTAQQRKYAEIIIIYTMYKINTFYSHVHKMTLKHSLLS